MTQTISLRFLKWKKVKSQKQLPLKSEHYMMKCEVCVNCKNEWQEAYEPVVGIYATPRMLMYAPLFLKRSLI